MNDYTTQANTRSHSTGRLVPYPHKDVQKDAQEAPQDQSKIRGELNLQVDTLCEVESVLDALEHKLDSVMSPIGPTPETNNKDQLRTSLSPIAESISCNTSRMRNITRRIEIILDRVEV